MFHFAGGLLVKTIAENVILVRMLVRNSKGKVVSQFHIRPIDDTVLRFSDVIFTEKLFNVVLVEKDRVVLAIWGGKRSSFAVCLIFAKAVDVEVFSTSISSYTREDIVIDESQALDFFKGLKASD